MKKLKIIVLALFCLFMTGCSNEFAKQEYDSVEKIAQTADRYAKKNSFLISTDKDCSLTVSEFDGRETLWTNTLEEDQNIEIDFSFSLSEGQAKVVHIDDAGNVTTVMECLPETSTDEFVTETVALKSGKNRFKIVGYDCKDVDLKMVFADAQ